MAPNGDNNDQDWFKKTAKSDGFDDQQASPQNSSLPASGNGQVGTNDQNDQFSPAQPRVPVGDTQPSQYETASSQDLMQAELQRAEAAPVGSYQQNSAPFYPPHAVENKKFWTKGKKIAFGTLAAILLLLIAGGVAAFAYYNAPDKVVGDAISNSLKADSARIKGAATVTGESEGQKGTLKIDYEVKSKFEAFQADMAFDVNVAPLSFKMSGSVLSDKDHNYYFKVDNAKQIVSNMFGAEYDDTDPAFDGLNGIVDMVDNKWIKVTEKDILEGATEDEKSAHECRSKLADDMYADDSFLDEIETTYRNNIFIKSEPLKSDDFSTLRYKLLLDEQKTKDFAKAFESTKLYDRIKACDKDFSIDHEDISRAVKEINKVSIEVEIDRWSHELQNMNFYFKDDDVEVRITAETKHNETFSITPPAQTTPFKDLMTEIEEVFGSMFSSFEDEPMFPEQEQDLITANGESNQSVLGLRNWNLFNR